jgi:hypothetical protein
MTTDGPTVAGEPAAVRLMTTVNQRRRPLQRPPLDPADVATVLHVLADHTAIMAALRWRRDEQPESPWQPDATSIGRWLHDVADQLERLPRRDSPEWTPIRE